MLKLLLTVRISRTGRKRDHAHSVVHRPILWPVCPKTDETFWVSKAYDYAFDVTQVTHWPAGDQIEIVFETNDYDDLLQLLNEENGGWLSGDDPGSMKNPVWPNLVDHPTATH